MADPQDPTLTAPPPAPELPARIEALKQKLEPFGFNFLGCLPHDDAVEEQVFGGKSLYEVNDTPATRAMDEIMKKLMEA